MTHYDAEQSKLKKYKEKTEQMLKEDGTVTCYGDTIMTDCNNEVSASSIALRELIEYADINSIIKRNIHTILINYGMMFENEYERIFDVISEIELLLGKKIATQVINMKLRNYLFDEIDIMEKVIDRILLKYYKDYNIPTDRYDDILYKSDDDEYNITITYKDMKTLIFQARDSGGNMDCFGFAHQDTTMNCIRAFVSEKLNIPIGTYYSFFENVNDEQKERLDNICEDIYDVVTGQQTFNIDTY